MIILGYLESFSNLYQMNRIITCTYTMPEQCTWALAINCNDPFKNWKVDPLEGGDEITIGLATVMTTCKGTLLNETVDDEFMKSSICRATA